MLILDIHAHVSERLLDKEWTWKQWASTEEEQVLLGSAGQTAEQFIEIMDSSNPRIDKAVVFGVKSLSSVTPEAMNRDNDYILKVVEDYPDRLIGAGLIDPSWGEKAIKEIHRFVNAGLRIVKMRFTSQRLHVNCKLGQKIFKEIENLGVLPIVHSDWTQFSHPMVIGDLALMFPDVKLVLQHFGSYLSRDAISIAKRAENIYVDTSGVRYPKDIITFINEVSPDRIMFGSDPVGVRGELQPKHALNSILCLDLPSEHEKKVLGENAAVLLRSMGVKI